MIRVLGPGQVYLLDKFIYMCCIRRYVPVFLSIALAASSTVAWCQDAEKPNEPVHEEAEKELKQQVHQRILGVIPNFNTSFIPNAAPLTSRQKFHLAFRSAIDPFQFVAAGMVAGIEQGLDSFHDYGQGAEGYGKRLGAAYADSFTGGILGGGVFPSLLHQDPRYFRKGTGSVKGRFFYAISTTVRTRNDHGKWVPNYSNILGNLGAGTISNLYYPS